MNRDCEIFRKLLVDIPQPPRILTKNEIVEFLKSNVDLLFTLRYDFNIAQSHIIEILETLTGSNLTSHDKRKGHTIAGRLAAKSKASRLEGKESPYASLSLLITSDMIEAALHGCQDQEDSRQKSLEFITSDQGAIEICYYYNKGISPVDIIDKFGLDITIDEIENLIVSNCSFGYKKGDLPEVVRPETVMDLAEEYSKCPVTLEEFSDEWGLNEVQTSVLEYYLRSNNLLTTMEDFLTGFAGRLLDAEDFRFLQPEIMAINGYRCVDYYIMPTIEAAEEIKTIRGLRTINITSNIPGWIVNELNSVAKKKDNAWIFPSIDSADKFKDYMKEKLRPTIEEYDFSSPRTVEEFEFWVIRKEEEVIANYGQPYKITFTNKAAKDLAKCSKSWNDSQWGAFLQRIEKIIVDPTGLDGLSFGLHKLKSDSVFTNIYSIDSNPLYTKGSRLVYEIDLEKKYVYIMSVCDKYISHDLYSKKMMESYGMKPKAIEEFEKGLKIINLERVVRFRRRPRQTLKIIDFL